MIASTEKIREAITLCGEQLIKDAPLIAGDFYGHQELELHITFDLMHEAMPTVRIESEYIPESYLKRKPAEGNTWLFVDDEKPQKI